MGHLAVEADGAFFISSDEIEIEADMFSAPYTSLVDLEQPVHRTRPSNCLYLRSDTDLLTKKKSVHFRDQTRLASFNVVRARANGRRAFGVPISLYGDDVGGNKSKQW